MYRLGSAFLILALSVMTFFSSSAYAACSSPVGSSGSIEYFSSNRLFYFCDNTAWVPWAGQPVSGIPAPQYTSSGASFPLLANPIGSVTAAAYSFNGDPNTGIYSPAADKVSVTAGGTERMRVTAAGVAINAAIDPPAALYVDGDIQFTGAMYDVSDMRMKTNIVPLSNSLTKLKSLDTFSFAMKDAAQGTPREYGVSAQQVQAVFPELVRSTGDNDMLTVSYSGLIAPLIDAVKELEQQVESLKAEVEALKSAQ